MKRVAFATAAAFPRLYPEERAVLGELKTLNIIAEPVVWDDHTVDWTAFAAVWIRSCWDYHEKPRAFLEWIDRLESAGVALWNPAPVVRWNLHKGYLLELAEAGIPILPTELVRAGEAVSLTSILVRRGWEHAVVKPAVSLGGFDTWRVGRGDDQESAFARLARDRDVLVQQFASGICTTGELSLVYLQGEFSHAVVKRPRAGEFRVQEEYGGDKTRVPPEPGWLAAGQRILARVSHPTAFARVDGVLEGDSFQLMELELIDPSLYLAQDPSAVERFARVVAGLSG